MATSEIKKLVLAYSGGLDTSVILRWVRDFYGCEVVAYCADVGQAEETAGLEQKALQTGASKLYLEDLREEFARDFVFPMMRANAIYESYYLLGTSIARPAIAKRQVEIAHDEGVRQQGLVDRLHGRAVGAEPDGAVGFAVDFHAPADTGLTWKRSRDRPQLASCVMFPKGERNRTLSVRRFRWRAPPRR